MNKIKQHESLSLIIFFFSIRFLISSGHSGEGYVRMFIFQTSKRISISFVTRRSTLVRVLKISVFSVRCVDPYFTCN